jgi:hypothetical protein
MGLFLKLTYWDTYPVHLPTYLDLFGSFSGCPNGQKIAKNGPNKLFFLFGLRRINFRKKCQFFTIFMPIGTPIGVVYEGTFIITVLMA